MGGGNVNFNIQKVRSKLTIRELKLFTSARLPRRREPMLDLLLS
jgi:hypothetical protein